MKILRRPLAVLVLSVLALLGFTLPAAANPSAGYTAAEIAAAGHLAGTASSHPDYSGFTGADLALHVRLREGAAEHRLALPPSATVAPGGRAGVDQRPVRRWRDADGKRLRQPMFAEQIWTDALDVGQAADRVAQAAGLTLLPGASSALGQRLRRAAVGARHI